MIHAEVVFVDRESAQDIVGRSCSIHYGGKVFLDQRRFSRKQWQFRSVSATKEQVKAAFKFCQEHVGDGFNKTGYYLQPFSRRIHHRGKAPGSAERSWRVAARERTFPCLHPQSCTTHSRHDGPTVSATAFRSSFERFV